MIEESERMMVVVEQDASRVTQQLVRSSPVIYPNGTVSVTVIGHQTLKILITDDRDR